MAEDKTQNDIKDMTKDKKNKPTLANMKSTEKITIENESMDDYLAKKCIILGRNIRIERKKRGFSIENLAEYIELSSSYVGLLERGQRCPSIKNLFNICDLFSGTPNDFLLERDDIYYTDKIAVAEEKKSSRSNKYEAVISLIKNLNESELEFLVSTLKSMKNLQR